MLGWLLATALLAAAPAARATAAPSPSATASPGRDAATLWREADAADHRERDYAKAIGLYDELLREFPDARLSRMAEARRDYLVRATAKGVEPLRRFETVRETFSTSDPKKATAEMEALAREYPDWPLADEVLLWLGDRYSELREWKKAVDAYQALLDRFPESPNRGYALAGIGHAHFERREYKEAEAAYAAIAGTSIPGAKQVSFGEFDRVRRHEMRRRNLTIAMVIAGIATLLAAATVDPRRLKAAARAAFGRELLYLAPILAILVLVSPSDARGPMAAIGGAGLAVLVIAVGWAEAARPSLASPGMRALSAAVALVAGGAVIYAVMYVLDVLIAVEKAVGA